MDHKPASDYLVYTSAGDRSQISRWRSRPGNFDLFITYYGDSPGSLRPLADYYNERKGGKFPNLHHAYQNWPEIFSQYRAVLVADDDVVISARSIDRLFTVRDKFDYAVIQPAYTPWGKVSHDITRVKRGYLKRETNFVEMTCPLFEQSFLARFIREYDPTVISFGIDWWFLHALGDPKGRVAVIDEVTCTNPHDYYKGGGREIDLCDSPNERLEAFLRVQRREGIKWDYMANPEYSAKPDYVAQLEYAVYPRRLVSLWGCLGAQERKVAGFVDRWSRRLRGLPFDGAPGIERTTRSVSPGVGLPRTKLEPDG